MIRYPTIKLSRRGLEIHELAFAVNDKCLEGYRLTHVWTDNFTDEINLSFECQVELVSDMIQPKVNE